MLQAKKMRETDTGLCDIQDFSPTALNEHSGHISRDEGYY
jgi:hypothetical protein